MKKDSKTIRDLIEETQAAHIPLSLISKAQFLALLNTLYPDEPFEKGTSDPIEMALAANYLDIKEASDSISSRFAAQIASFETEKNLPKALDFYKSIKKLPKELRGPFEIKMAPYFGSLISKAEPEKREELFKQYQKNKITSLSFAKDKNVVQFLARLSEIESLKYLDLSNTNLTDKEIELLSRSLTSLNLSFCNQITNEGVGKLPQALTSLDLAHCYQITDEGAGKLPQGLTSLSLSGCDLITDEGVNKLPQSHTSLDLSWCDKITSGAKDALRQRGLIVIG